MNIRQKEKVTHTQFNRSKLFLLLMSKVLFLSRSSLRKFTGCRKESPWCNEDWSSARVLGCFFFFFLFFRGRVFPSRCGFSLKGRRKELVALVYMPCVHDSFVPHKRFASGTTWERIFVTFGLSFSHVFDGCCRDKKTVSAFSIRKFIDLIVVDDFNRAFVFVFD